MKNNRFLTDFNASTLETETYDVLIIGSGIAGVYTALELSGDLSVAILSKETIDISNSVLAQGGIAVSLDEEDSPELHFKDTLNAGADLCNEESVWVLVNEAAPNIDCLCKFGVNFDRNKHQGLSLTREAAHSKNRIIHAGDTTGKEVCDTLISVVEKRSNVTIKERMLALDLLTEGGACKGVLAYEEDTGSLKVYRSNIVVCATGGYGQIYFNTTNPEVSTGDGLCLAYRAGAKLMDLEFIQFHPTVLFHPENKSFLISEAVRGEGALLRNKESVRFMPQYHPQAELAPRDIVSRAIFEEMRKTQTDHVYLDITFKDKTYLENRFPNIHKTCLGYGIDITKDFIPVAPAEHYCMGGIKTDVYGRTDIEGFYACGEAACNGIHGANRLASNSLLEGLVFGHKIANEINEVMEQKPRTQGVIKTNFATDRKEINVDVAQIIHEIQMIMTHNVGIVRNQQGLIQALEKIKTLSKMVENRRNQTIKDFELTNLLLLSKLVIESALEREESRGAHFRSDFSKLDNEKWRKNIIKEIGDQYV